MKYSNITEGRFIRRNNRFTAEAEINGIVETVHVKNTGRLKELLIPDAKIWLTCPGNEGRKTKYDLISVEKPCADNGIQIVNIDSQIPNAVALDWLMKSSIFSSGAVFKREVTYLNSRFDIYVEDGARKAFMEVKGVTLEKDNCALFPDAPTERGVKHLNELIDCQGDGYEAYMLFVIQMKGVNSFRPNFKTHRLFADTLAQARNKGVNVLAIDCLVSPDSICADSPIEVILEEK